MLDPSFFSYSLPLSTHSSLPSIFSLPHGSGLLPSGAPHSPAPSCSRRAEAGRRVGRRRPGRGERDGDRLTGHAAAASSGEGYARRRAALRLSPRSVPPHSLSLYRSLSLLRRPHRHFFHSLSLISSCPHGGNREEAVPPLTRPRGGVAPALGWGKRSEPGAHSRAGGRARARAGLVTGAAPMGGGWRPGSERAVRPRPRATHLQMGGGCGSGARIWQADGGVAAGGAELGLAAGGGGRLVGALPTPLRPPSGGAEDGRRRARPVAEGRGGEQQAATGLLREDRASRRREVRRHSGACWPFEGPIGPSIFF
ncbi:hypothetical protein PVAP13_9KG579301 [Panicum virgatum]|uniref:Uncharacterized protein n=1 Tax=Panicum virgatum TaxID=38727 RepID=A0A8T0P6L1_PANVG|nr:hypothetical protein PVAP13_9KG579301 [Panicum virgatum]